MTRRKANPARRRLTCAWCVKPIADNAEVFTLSTKIRPGFHLAQEQPGQITDFHLLTTGRNVPVIVAGVDSEAKKDGKHLMFPPCNITCGKALEATLHHEKGLVDPVLL